MKQFDLKVDSMPCRLLVGSAECFIDGRRCATDIRRLGPDNYSVIVDGCQHTVVVCQLAADSYEAHVAGATLAIEIRDPRRLSSHVTGSETGGPQAVRAPMPGKVLSVLVQIGDEVSVDEGLLVVEAMKMQNELRASRAGRVTAVKVNAGDSVSAGDTLVVVE